LLICELPLPLARNPPPEPLPAAFPIDAHA